MDKAELAGHLKRGEVILVTKVCPTLTKIKFLVAFVAEGSGDFTWAVAQVLGQKLTKDGFICYRGSNTDMSFALWADLWRSLGEEMPPSARYYRLNI